MKNLEEVTLESREVPLLKDGRVLCCHNSMSKLKDRTIHRAGSCIVHLGALHGHCPSLLRYDGIELGKMSKSFSLWNNKLKSLFYDEYITKGGERDFQTWVGAMWFKSQPKVPTLFGRDCL